MVIRPLTIHSSLCLSLSGCLSFDSFQTLSSISHFHFFNLHSPSVSLSLSFSWYTCVYLSLPKNHWLIQILYVYKYKSSVFICTYLLCLSVPILSVPIFLFWTSISFSNRLNRVHLVFLYLFLYKFYIFIYQSIKSSCVSIFFSYALPLLFA